MPSLQFAIIGASARAAAASALRAGHLPACADLFADADLRQVCPATRIVDYPDGFARWLVEQDVAGWIYTGGLENYPELINDLSAIRPLWGNAGDGLRRVRSPHLVGQVLARAGLLFPETRATATGLPSDGSWLVKNCHGSSGSGVKVLTSATRRTVGEDHTTVYQRRVQGTPIAAVFVAASGDARLLGITRQLVGTDWSRAGEFQYAGSVGPWPVSEPAWDAIHAAGCTLAREFRPVGLFGLDLVLNETGPWTIEVNPRYTASVEIIERVTGSTAIDQHIEVCTGRDILQRRTCPVHKAAGKAILFARETVEITPGFAEWAAAASQQVPWPAIADVPPVGTIATPGQPITTLLVAADNEAQVLEMLPARVAKAESLLYA